MKARFLLFIAVCLMLALGLKASLECFYIHAPRIAHYDGDYTVAVGAEIDIPYLGHTATVSLLRVGGGQVTESRQAGMDVDVGELFTLEASRTYREFTQGNIIEYIGEAYDGSGNYESAHHYVGVDVRPSGSPPWSWVDEAYIQNDGPQNITAHIRFGAYDGDGDLAGMRMTVQAPDGTLYNYNGPFMETLSDEHFQDFTFPIDQNGTWQFWVDVRDEIQVELGECTQSAVASLVVTEWGQSPVQPPDFLNIAASVISGQTSASGGGNMTVLLGARILMTSTAAASSGWLSEHNIKLYTPGPVSFPIPGDTATLAAEEETTMSVRNVTWTPPGAGTYTIYAEAFTGAYPGARQYGISGWPGYADGPYGGLANKRITINVIDAADTTPPTTPGNVVASWTASNGVVITWSPSTDNVGVTGYEILCDGIVKGSTNQLSYALFQLQPSTTHAIAVCAVDAAGNRSAFSVPVNVTTLNATTPVLLTPPMTGNTAPSPYAVTSNSTGDSNGPPWRAFDQNKSKTFHSGYGQQNDWWIAIDLGVEQAVSNIKIYSREQINYQQDTPSRVTVSYSSDGVSWTVAKTISGIPQPTAVGALFFDEDVNFQARHVKLSFINDRPNQRKYQIIGEIELYGPGEPAPEPVNDAVFIPSGSGNVPATMLPGETAAVSVTMQNTGNTTWDNNPSHPYSLGSQNPQDNTTWGLDRISVGGTPVQPGETKTFTFSITAPSTPGNYNFQWRMVQDGVEWFGAPSTNAILSVVAPPMSVTAVLDEPSIEYGQSVTITSAISAPAQNLQWHGIWITEPGASADYSQAAAWMSRAASGSTSTLSGTFAPSAAGGWMIHANGHETSGAWGPGADRTLTVGKTTPALVDCVAITLLPATPLTATTHLTARAINPHNPDAAAPSATYTIIAGGNGNTPDGTVLAPSLVLPSGTYTIRVSTPETGNYNAVTRDVMFTVKDSASAEERLHNDLGFNPDAATRADTGDIEADVYTPAQ